MNRIFEPVNCWHTMTLLEIFLTPVKQKLFLLFLIMWPTLLLLLNVFYWEFLCEIPLFIRLFL